VKLLARRRGSVSSELGIFLVTAACTMIVSDDEMGKFHPRTVSEHLAWEERYISTLSLTSAPEVDGVGGQR
jgi:hypothetical protein